MDWKQWLVSMEHNYPAHSKIIFKNPTILLSDEATSALDAESKRVVKDALNNIMVYRATRLVAHRLSSVKNSNTISVLHCGQLVEQSNLNFFITFQPALLQ
jgi:ATP-binding cassette subfamily B (MDR/TAP) protein 1